MTHLVDVYLLLTKSDEELLNLRNSEGSKIFQHKQAISKSRTVYLKGEGVGSPLILKYAGGALKRDKELLELRNSAAQKCSPINKLLLELRNSEAQKLFKDKKGTAKARSNYLEPMPLDLCDTSILQPPIHIVERHPLVSKAM